MHPVSVAVFGPTLLCAVCGTLLAGQASAICLLYQMSLGDEGPFAPYLHTLPYVDTFADWSKEELAYVDPYVTLTRGSEYNA